MINYKSYKLPAISLLLAASFISGCNDDDDSSDSGQRSYKVSVLNLTANQPLSPPAILIHQSTYHAFADGSAASAGLELLAEGGDNSALLSEAQADAAHIGSMGASQPIGPGGTDNYQLTIDDDYDAHLSMVSMLVNTNDGFTAINAFDIENLAVNQIHTMNLPAWDAGTEANSEATGTIPGPADGGEGFNAARDDLADFVGFHRGVISADDGLATSILNESHRFDNPAARISITRIE